LEWLGYTRVSRVGDRVDTLISPDIQAQRIQGYADTRGVRVRLLPPELDVSGAKVDRPILTGAIEAIERREAAGLIVAQLDRLSRMSLVDALKTIERIEVAGGKVIAVAENFDVDTDEGRTSRNLFLVMGDMQLNRYKAQFANAKAQAVARGIWPLPVVPIGYEKGADRRLVPGKDAPKVIRAFELRAGGASWPVIARTLQMGLTSVRKVVYNRVYLGEINYGEWRNPQAHDALVGRDLFEAAHIYHPPPPRSRREPALLAGLVRCSACGYRMSVDSDSAIYKCRPHKATGTCAAPALISKPKLERTVSDAVRKHVETTSLEYRAVEKMDAIAKAEDELATAEEELRLYQAVTKVSEIGAEHFAEGMRQRVEAVEIARRNLARARLAAPALPAGKGLDDLTPEEFRQGLRGALGVVWVRKNRRGAEVRIVAAGFEPSEFGPIDWTDSDLPGEIGTLGLEGPT
jgi:DNA invertase Pin-like site-specific DNA recombinase